MDNINENIWEEEKEVKFEFTDLSALLARYKKTEPETKKTRDILDWQTLALEILKEINFTNKGSLFRCCKIDSRAAKFALNDCRELHKPYANYFFKLWYILHYGPDRILQTK